MSGFAVASTVTVAPEVDIEAVNLQPDEAVVCSPFDGATFAYLHQIEGLRIYGPAVCDQGLPVDRRQIYAPTLSNPLGAPLAVHVVADTCEGGVVHEDIVNRLSWMGAIVVEDPALADLFLANTHNHYTKVWGV